MKKIVIIGSLTFISIISIITLLIYINSNNEDKIEQNLETINLEEWKDIYESDDVVIIDVRTLDEFNQGHIENASNIDYYSSDFEEKISKLDKNKKYLIYCRSGSRSGRTLEVMRSMNFKTVKNLKNGMVGWTSSNYKIVK